MTTPALAQPPLPGPLRALVDFFREPEAIPRLTDRAEIDRRYAHWRARMLWGSLAAYALFYLTRKNISAALPLLSRDLGYDDAQLGILGSLIYASYMVSKPILGLVGDRVDPRKFLAVGLTLSALANVFFSFSSSLAAFGTLWFLNGIFQAMGSPPCAKVCVRWFSVSERGTKWAVWNTSHQVGGGVVMILAGWLGHYLGWQGAFWGPALICLAGAVVLWIVLGDRPEAVGLPPVDEYRNDPETSGPEAQGEPEESGLALIVRRVLLNPTLLTLAVASLLVYVARYGALDWGTKYLVEVKGQETKWAATVTSLVEFVGIPGCLAAGWISDRLFKARRAPVCVFFLAALAACIGLLWLVPRGHPWLDAAALSGIGFFVYGPQMLLAGVGAADACGAKVAAAAVGVTGAFSYLGAIVSSAGTGWLVKYTGWSGAFWLWAGSAVLAGLVIVPLWNSRGRQR